MILVLTQQIYRRIYWYLQIVGTSNQFCIEQKSDNLMNMRHMENFAITALYLFHTFGCRSKCESKFLLRHFTMNLHIQMNMTSATTIGTIIGLPLTDSIASDHRAW